MNALSAGGLHVTGHNDDEYGNHNDCRNENCKNIIHGNFLSRYVIF